MDQIVYFNLAIFYDPLLRVDQMSVVLLRINFVIV